MTEWKITHSHMSETKTVAFCSIPITFELSMNYHQFNHTQMVNTMPINQSETVSWFWFWSIFSRCCFFSIRLPTLHFVFVLIFLSWLLYFTSEQHLDEIPITISRVQCQNEMIYIEREKKHTLKTAIRYAFSLQLRNFI